ncbi:MAG: hypothetical protein Q7J77_11590 [Undibacterium sp.]|nr:hypothetical protein [Undibacterium sp.]
MIAQYPCGFQANNGLQGAWILRHYFQQLASTRSRCALQDMPSGITPNPSLLRIPGFMYDDSLWQAD